MKNRLELLYIPEGGEGGGGETPPVGGETPPNSFADTITDPEIRENVKKMFPDIKDFTTLAKTAVHQQRELGKPKVTLPGKDAKPEDIKQFYVKNFNVPEKVDGYKFDAIKIPEGFNLKTPEQVTAFKAELKPFAEVFHKANLNEAQATEVVNAFYEHAAGKIAGEQAAANDMAAKSRQALQQEWGADYESRMNGAELALSTLGGQEFADKVKSMGLHNDATFIKFLANASLLMREDRSTDGLSPGGFATGPNQAKAEIESLMADAQFVKDYRDTNSPNFQRNQERIQNLYQIANGEKGRKLSVR